MRYKAWQAPFGLHPAIEVHAPLTFDLFDRRLGRSVGGCVYHVAHPGGLAYEAFPVNAYEAETRRISRFWAFGHGPGDLPAPDWTQAFAAHYRHDPAVTREPPAEPLNPDFPCTLDLRRPL